MEKTEQPPRLLYLNEHRTCTNYRADVGTGFHYISLPQDEDFVPGTARCHHIAFLLEGHCMFILNKLERRELHAGQMLLIPRDTQVEGYHQQPLRLIDFTFEAILNNCDKLALSATGKEASQQPIQSFRPLDICSPLDQFLQLLTVLLQSGINCVHLHMLKHQELFLLLRGYYKKEELREFLHPVIARNFDFKEFVYREAAHHNSVEEIVKQSNMSRSTFQRKFQMEFGESPNSWLRKHICQRIVAELSQPGVSLKGVAMKLNFSSAGSLTRFCKQNFHCTPSELKAGVEKKIGE